MKTLLQTNAQKRSSAQRLGERRAGFLNSVSSLSLCFLLLTLLLVPALRAPAAEPPMLTVAVFDFESKDPGVAALGPQLATLVNVHLSTEPNLILVERAELEKALGEQELGLAGTVSADTAAQVGHLTGAKVLISGRAFKVDKETLVVAKIISTETSRVYGEMAKGAGASSVTDLAAELAGKIAKVLNEKSATLVAKVVPRADRIRQLVAKLKDAKRPAVSVKIAERHFGGPVIDPAAETELLLVLQETGFTVVDDQSQQKADVEITGEAFSAYGLRKGNLISCRARVEIKAHEKGTGKILAADRQTSVAVDIAEPTAAKTALQHAAFELAERLLPRLSK